MLLKHFSRVHTRGSPPGMTSVTLRRPADLQQERGARKGASAITKQVNAPYGYSTDAHWLSRNLRGVGTGWLECEDVVAGDCNWLTGRWELVPGDVLWSPNHSSALPAPPKTENGNSFKSLVLNSSLGFRFFLRSFLCFLKTMSLFSRFLNSFWFHTCSQEGSAYQQRGCPAPHPPHPHPPQFSELCLTIRCEARWILLEHDVGCVVPEVLGKNFYFSLPVCLSRLTWNASLLTLLVTECVGSFPPPNNVLPGNNVRSHRLLLLPPPSDANHEQ